jgi:hypothetical protein
MTRDRDRHELSYHPLDPGAMARICRRLASDMRSEAEMGWPGISMAYHSVAGEARGTPRFMTREEAAASMDAQAARWDAEARGGPRNAEDRAKIGC